jgi:hypothetical protein
LVNSELANRFHPWETKAIVYLSTERKRSADACRPCPGNE